MGIYLEIYIFGKFFAVTSYSNSNFNFKHIMDDGIVHIPKIDVITIV